MCSIWGSKKLNSAVALGMILCSGLCSSEELASKNAYRTTVRLKVCESLAGGTCTNQKHAGQDSKFEVLDNSNKDYYAVKFNKVYKPKGMPNDTQEALEGETYYLTRNVGTDQNVPIENSVKKSFSGLVSGPLIVPFKYRKDDKSFSGEAMVGLYAGVSVDFFNTGAAVTPFLSAGISQIEVADTSSEEKKTTSRSGFTWATGLLFQNWDSINIGLVYGQDRIGDGEWEHEGEGWWSISVGWKLEI